MPQPQCKYCYNQGFYTFHPYLNPHKKTKTDPIYSFHIGIGCLTCDKNSGFITQTPELIVTINRSFLIPQDTLPNAHTETKKEE